VLIATALTGAGVPELFAALDRRHAAWSADGSGPAARLARARTELLGIVTERLAERLREPALAALTDGTLAAIAAHRLDPYAGADAILDALAYPPARPDRMLRPPRNDRPSTRDRS
jgi:putative protein kinase ArgK-like GTPase of G3E family